MYKKKERFYDFRKEGYELIIKRGDIFFADLNPVVGSEQGRIRPGLVVQNDVGNKHSPIVVVVPISAADKKDLPVHFNLKAKGLPRKSTILAEQIRTVDRCRIKEYVGSLDNEMMKEVDRILKISIGVGE